jgi:hypothetical protein
MVRYLAEFEWRFNHCFDLAAMIPALGRAAVATKPQPYWWLKMADYGAQSGERIAKADSGTDPGCVRRPALL